MRNRLLQITRSVIAYLPELKPYTGSVVGCLLMQQMDFWFNQKPNGFYKFLSPSEHPDYRPGDSWTEELAISEAEFRTAIDKICHRWTSKSSFDAADDKFQGKFYCSVYDRRRQLTTYFRNHPLVDACLDELAARNAVQASGPSTPSGQYEFPREKGQNGQFPRQGGPESPIFAVAQQSQLTVNQESKVTVTQESSFTGSEDSQDTVSANSSATVSADMQGTGAEESASARQLDEVDFLEEKNGSLPIKAKKTTSNNTKQQQPDSGGSCGFEEVVFPEWLTPTEKPAVESMLVGCPPAYRQDVLDELDGYKRAGDIRASTIGLMRQLIEAAKAGTFKLSRGIAVKDAREVRVANAQRLSAAQQLHVDPASISADALNKLPPNMRARALASLGRTE